VAQAATWAGPDTEGRQRGERTGLDTRVVHAVNDVGSAHGQDHLLVCPSTRDKPTAWELRAQA
jgi:hypothetical protein